MSLLCILPFLFSICNSTWFTDYLLRPYCVSRGLRKILKFVPGGPCILVKVFFEFKNGLGFYLPCLDHEIPKSTECWSKEKSLPEWAPIVFYIYIGARSGSDFSKNESALQSTLAVFNMQIHVVHPSKIEHRDYTIRQDHSLYAEAILCLKGPQKKFKIRPR